jgi:opacity protein-like surface antigen
MKLIKFLSFVILTILLHMPLQAQWEIGGLIDLNLAGINVSGSNSSEDYSSYLGFGIGAVVDRSLTGPLDLHAEPMFLQKGAKLKSGSTVILFKVHYLEIPLMFRYTFQLNESLLPYALAGPSIGLLTSAKYHNKDGGEQDEKDNTKFFDFGVGFGGGVKYPWGNKTFFGELRYVLGLVNINKEEDEFEVKNRGLQLVVGITIPVGG